MRLLLFFLLVSPLLADEVLLREVRAWKGEMSVESRSDPGRAGTGSEVQTERADFVVLTDPRRTAGAREKLRLQIRRTEGSWRLAFDLKEHKAGGDLATTGEGSGELHFSLSGYLDPTTRVVRFKTGARPHRLVAKTTLSGVDAEGLAAFRTVASRDSFLSALEEQGMLSEDLREVSGERTFVDRRGKFPRTVTVRWKLVRLEPEVKGRLLDQTGRPVAGMRVLARTWAAGRMLAREDVTDVQGRFRIPAHFASWGVQVLGSESDGIVTAGLTKADAAVIRFDEVPDVELRVTRYRLEWLPRPELLAGYFKGDVDRFLAYLKERVPAARLAGAELKSATN